ncbi:MAG: hypothetical protein GVY36_08240 [Verrucomicrobia bacterium]|jgi:outer membrane murein-binding lipoprotein Lpp|nr:hypothetical protein [Verrucomicrobiota bacterium]
MGFIKKNLVFSVVLLVCLLAFAAGAYLTYAEIARISQQEQTLRSAKTQLNSVLNADPSPTEANVEATRKNVRELTAELESIRTSLEQGARLNMSTDGIQVMASIQQFITDYQKKAEQNIRQDDEAVPISLPDDFAFGFEQYIDEATIPDDPEVIPVLDKQRQIISYLLNKLFSADPHSIESVKREVLENKSVAEGAGDRRRNRSEGFKINPAISASVPGAIETLGFRLTFTGHTDTLRKFLNSLARFDLPIIVRSVEVERAENQVETVTPADNASNLNAIFGVFGDEAAAEENVEPEEVQKPVIAENVSSFTVTLEFIEVVLPEATKEENL